MKRVFSIVAMVRSTGPCSICRCAGVKPILKILAGLILVVILAGPALADRPGPIRSCVLAEMMITYDIQGSAEKIEFTIALPETIPHRQRILDITYSHRPKRIYAKNGGLYAVFVFKKLRWRTQLQIRIKAELFRYDLITARKLPRRKPKPRNTLTRYVLPGPHYDVKDPAIQALANSVTETNQIRVIRELHKLTTDALEYKQPSKRAGAAVALDQPGRAARLIGAADALFEKQNYIPQSGDLPEFERYKASAREALDEASFETAWAEGQAMTHEEAIAYALEGSTPRRLPLG